MNKLVPVGIGIGAVVVAAVVGARLLLPQPGGVGAPPSTQPSPTPAPSAAPSATPSRAPESRHVLWSTGIPMTVTLQAPGWEGTPGDGILEKNGNSDAPNGAGLIVFADGEYFVYSDPCQWSTTKPDTTASTVDEVVAALSAQLGRDASEPVDISLDGYAGKSITLHVPVDAVHSGGEFTECDQSMFASWGVPAENPARWHQGPGQIDKLWIVDVNGEVAIIDIAYYPGTPQAVVDELEAMVESLTFE